MRGITINASRDIRLDERDSPTMLTPATRSSACLRPAVRDRPD